MEERKIKALKAENVYDFLLEHGMSDYIPDHDQLLRMDRQFLLDVSVSPKIKL